MDEENLVNLLKQAHDDGVRFGFRMAVAIVRGCLTAWNDPRVAAAAPDEAAARRDQLERVLKSLLEEEMKLQ